MESFQIVWKVSGQSKKFQDSLESFRTVWKISRQCGKFLDSLESFRTLWKLFRWSGKFPDDLESFQLVRKLSTPYRKFLDKYFIVCNIHIVHFCIRIVLALWHVCRESDLRTFGTYMSQKQFTHFWRIYVAKAIYPLRSGSFGA